MSERIWYPFSCGCAARWNGVEQGMEFRPCIQHKPEAFASLLAVARAAKNYRAIVKQIEADIKSVSDELKNAQ